MGSSARRALNRGDGTGAPVAVSGWLPGCVAALLVGQLFVPGVGVARQGYGAIFVVLWLVLAAAWQFYKTRHRLVDANGGAEGDRHNLLRRLRKLSQSPSNCVAAFFAVMVTSGVVAVFTASTRPALNATWHWLAGGVAYFLFRQAFVDEVLQRAVVAVVIAAAAAMAGIGLEQAWVSFPQDRDVFDRLKDNPQALYQQTGQWLPEGSPQRRQFEARLETNNPNATFALANSLAGLLCLGGVLAVGVVVTSIAPGKWLWRTSICLLVFGPIVYCLWLTQSRTGVIALATGLVAVAFCGAPRRGWVRLVIFMSVFLGGLAAVIVGWLYLEQIAQTSAGKSLLFRIEYWIATAGMISENPWLGCGLGQFQDAYTAFKLPAASEEVADPHNWLLEVCATGGCISGLLLIFALQDAGRRGSRGAADALRGDLPTHQGDVARRRVVGVFVGAAAGTLLGAFASWLDLITVAPIQVVIAMALLVVSLSILFAWVLAAPGDGQRHARFISEISIARLAVIGIVTLLVHWTASGGIGEPALATIFWLLLAVTATLGDKKGTQLNATSEKGAASHLRTLAAAIVLSLLAVAGYWTFYRPVLGAAGYLAEADAHALSGQNAQRIEAIERAVAADPWSVEATRRLAILRFAVHEQNPTPTHLAEWQAADGRALELAPRRHKHWRQSADHFAQLHLDTSHEQFLTKALIRIDRAIQLYPTHADHHLLRAELLLRSGDGDAAHRAAETAKRLEDAKRSAGHDDKALPPQRRELLESILAERG